MKSENKDVKYILDNERRGKPELQNQKTAVCNASQNCVPKWTLLGVSVVSFFEAERFLND